MKKSRYVWIVLGLALTAFSLNAGAAPTPINNPTGGVQNPWSWDGANNQELNLYEVYNHVYSTSLTAAQFAEILTEAPADETFWTVDRDVELESIARYAGWRQRFGYYDLNDPNDLKGDGRVTSSSAWGLDGLDISAYGGGVTTVSVPHPGFQGPPATFGIWTSPDTTALTETWYSEESLNSDGYDHFVTAWSPWLYDAVADEYYRELFIGIEDNRPNGPFGGADWDYQDLVVTLRHATIVPEPSSMVLLGIGVAGIAAARMRKRSRK